MPENNNNNDNFNGKRFQRSGGRGHRKQNWPRGQKTTNTNRQPEFTVHSHGQRRYHTYDSVKELIIEDIQKSYEFGYDIAKSLRDLRLIDLDLKKPKRQISTETDQDKKEFGQQ